jgi:hypothetical protein
MWLSVQVDGEIQTSILQILCGNHYFLFSGYWVLPQGRNKQNMKIIIQLHIVPDLRMNVVWSFHMASRCGV